MRGQITIILLLVVVIGLSVALSVVGRSTTELFTSTRTEQSTRAFSAAEAGIEQALSGMVGVAAPIVVGDSRVDISDRNNLPATGQALEYPPIGKEEIAQFWLKDFRGVTPAVDYTHSSFYIYFGNCEEAGNCAADTDKPAVEVTTITQTGISYTSFKKFYDSDSDRRGGNRFEAATCSTTPVSVVTSMSNTSKFYCQATVTGYLSLGTPILARVRLLYANGKHKIALGKPGTGCGATDCDLPPQARLITSTGTSGETQRQLQLFTVEKVVPFFFDYAIFSAGAISK